MIILAQKRIKALVESETVALMNLPLEDVVLWRDAAHPYDLHGAMCEKCDCKIYTWEKFVSYTEPKKVVKGA